MNPVQQVKTELAFDRGPGPIGRIGLVVLANDPVCEIECASYLTDPAISLHVTRVPSPADFSPPTLAQLEPQIVSAVATLLPADRMDCIALACASAASAIGRPRLGDLVEQLRPGVSFTDPGQAAVEVMRIAGIRRISLLLTPTEPETNALAVRAYAEAGFEVLKAATCGLGTDRLMSTASLGFIQNTIAEVDHPRADIILVPCTALRTWMAIRSLPKTLCARVMTGNQAMMQHAKELVSRQTPQV